METPLSPVETIEKNRFPETTGEAPAKKSEGVSQIYETPATEESVPQEIPAGIGEKIPPVVSPGIVEKKTGKKFEGHSVEKTASALTKKADEVETEALEGITEIHNLPNAKP